MSISFYGGFIPGTFPGTGGGGEAGRGISQVKIDENGRLIINYTDGTSEDVGEVVGKNGYTFIPSIDSDGVLSWTNDGNLPNPDSVDLTIDTNEPDDTDYWGTIGEMSEIEG